MIVKTPEQRKNLIEAGKRLSNILNELVKMTKVGLSTEKYHDKVVEIAKKLGDSPAFLNYTPEGASRPYPSSVCVSINEEVVHGIPNEKPKILKDGDIVSLDVGLEHKNIIVDSARTVVVGEIDKKTQKLLDIMNKAIKVATAQAKNGNRTGDIGQAVSSVVPKGYSVPKELGGHGVGDKVHEMPFIPNYGKKGKGEKLIKGQVIAIEPMIIESEDDRIIEEDDGYTISTESGARSVHIERTLLIEEKGAPTIIAS